MNTEDKLVIYQAADGAIELPVDAKLETIWASQRQIAEVFGVNVRTVNEHLGQVDSSEATDLALAFATTWLSLDAYDKSALPLHFWWPRASQKTKTR